MTRERRLDDLLDAWEEIVEAGRSLDLHSLCGDCPELLPELKRRISAIEDMDQFVAAGTSAPVDDDTPDASAEAYGRYRPMRFHAAGGLGEIMIARDEELGRDVALKRIQERWRHNAESRRRFVTEAEITGRLEHPGIVPVYGLGHDERGQPYYAMRFIRGRSLLEAIDSFHHQSDGATAGERHVALQKLLRNFLAACHTIAYAHSLGVLHRDLKPANIMIGDYGETLVVDWGLAKSAPRPSAPVEPAQGSPGAGSTVVGARSGETAIETITHDASPLVDSGPDAQRTLAGQVKGSPAYMGPEQAEGRWSDVGRRSDVYGLGATLYTLLTGERPVRGSSIGEVLDNARAGRFIPVRQANPDVPRPLAAICEKAISRSMEDRYAGAIELAGDIERWLADEPVLAHRESIRERTARWTRRHRAWTQASAAALVLVTIVSVAAVILVDGARRGERAALDQVKRSLAAETEAKNQAKRAVDDYVRAVQDEELLRDERWQPLRKRLLANALAYYQTLIQQQSDNPGAQRDLSRAQMQAAMVSVLTGSRSEALAALERARGLLSLHARRHPDDAELRLDLAETLLWLSDLQGNSIEQPKAEANAKQARKLLDSLAAPADTSPRARSLLAHCYHSLAMHQQAGGKLDEAQKLLRRAIECYEKLEKDKALESGDAAKLAGSFRALTALELESGDPEAAQAAAEQARRRLTALLENRNDSVAAELELNRVENQLAALLLGRGRPREALAALQSAAKRFEAVVLRNPTISDYRHNLAQTHNNIGAAWLQLGEPRKAAEAFQRSVEHHQRVAAEHPNFPYYGAEMASTCMNLGAAYSRAGEYENAKGSYLRARETLVKVIAAAPSQAAKCSLGEVDQNLALLHLDQNRPDDAVRAADSAIAGFRELVVEAPHTPLHHYHLAKSLHNLGMSHAAAARHAEALAPFQESISRLAELAKAYPQAPEYRSAQGGSLSDRGYSLASLGRTEEAIASFESAIELQSALVEESPHVAHFRRFLSNHLGGLADSLDSVNRRPEAIQAAARRLALWSEGAGGLASKESFASAADLARLLSASATGDEPELQQRVDEHLPSIVAALKKLKENGELSVEELTNDERFDAVRNLPAMRSVLEK